MLRVRVRVSIRVKIKVRVSSSILPNCRSAGLVHRTTLHPWPRQPVNLCVAGDLVGGLVELSVMPQNCGCHVTAHHVRGGG